MPKTATILTAFLELECAVPKRSAKATEDFGTRLARLRTAAGYSQREFAAVVGITQRMVAYYEGETTHPPTTLLPRFAATLNVTADELLGLQPVQRSKVATDSRLWRRFKQVEQLPAQDRREILRIIDAFLELDEFKRRVDG